MLSHIRNVNPFIKISQTVTAPSRMTLFLTPHFAQSFCHFIVYLVNYCKITFINDFTSCEVMCDRMASHCKQYQRTVSLTEKTENMGFKIFQSKISKYLHGFLNGFHRRHKRFQGHWLP